MNLNDAMKEEKEKQNAVDVANNICGKSNKIQ